MSESLKQFGMGPKTTSVVIIETSSNDLTEWEKSKAFESDKDVTFRHDSGLIREAYKVPADFPDVDILKYVVNVISTKNI